MIVIYCIIYGIFLLLCKCLLSGGKMKSFCWEVVVVDYRVGFLFFDVIFVGYFLGVINEKVMYFGYYEDLVEKFMGKYNFVIEEIERDLYRFFLEYLAF